MGRKSKKQLEKERGMEETVYKINEWHERAMYYEGKSKDCEIDITNEYYIEVAKVFLKASCVLCKFNDYKDELQSLTETHCQKDENFKNTYDSLEDDENSAKLFLEYFRRVLRNIKLSELQAPELIMVKEILMREEAKENYEKYICKNLGVFDEKHYIRLIK